jgi:hypothetical protein
MVICVVYRRDLPPPEVEATSTSSCRHAMGRHGPLRVTATDGRVGRLTCLHGKCRHALPPCPSAACGHVSYGGTAATLEGVFFANSFHRWSFLSINWGGWSVLTKIQFKREIFASFKRASVTRKYPTAARLCATHKLAQPGQF